MPDTRTPKSRGKRNAASKKSGMAPLLPGSALDLDELLDSAATPESATLLVGVAGSGRTTILEHVRANTPLRTVWIAPHPWERFRPLAGLSIILSALGDKRVGDRLDTVDNNTLTADATLAVAADIVHLLTTSPREDTLLLVDDADGFDDHSQLALTYLAARLGGTGIRLIMAVTPESTYAAFAGLRSVWVSRLDSPSSMELAQAIAPSDADPQTLSIVVDACGGLPGMISSTISHLTADQFEGLAPLALPLYPGPAALAFDNWEHESVVLLRRLSSAPISSVAAVPELRGSGRDRFERLTSQGVLELKGRYVSIRDGALRSALYWSMSSSQREALHRAAAVDEAAHSEALALWHTDHVDLVVESSAALLRGASTLFAEGLIDAATELTERALLLSLGMDEVLDPLIALCDQLMILSEFALARRYLTLCKQTAKAPTQLAECLRLEVTIASLDDSRLDIGAIDVYAHRYRRDSPGTSAELLSFASVALATSGEIVAARAHIDRAYELRPAGDTPSGSMQHWTRRFIDATDGRGSGQATAEDESLTDLDALGVSTLLICGRALTMEERYDAARHVFRSLELSVPRRSRGAAWSGRLLSLSAVNEIRAGNVAEASALIDDLAALGPAQNLDNFILFAWNESVVRDRPDADALIAEARARSARTHQPVLAAKLLWLEGSVALMHNDLDEARFRLARAYEPAMELRPDYLRIEGDFVEVLARRAEWDAARRVAEQFAERAAAHPSAWTEIVLARSRAIVAPEDRVLLEFRNALETARKYGNQLELGRARLSFAAALERFGDVERAGEQRRAAENLFETLAAGGWVRAARESGTSVEAPLRNSMLATLTENELAVLRLMRKGVRNKDIAAALFVSLRTVEVRITQIYRKLEARSRSHLLTLLPTELDRRDSL
ncbi:MAG TPA: LuxR C-terminal-related transcriptional regulator [Galbitalea sp.]